MNRETYSKWALLNEDDAKKRPPTGLSGSEVVHTIPVPAGWSAEQAWEAISRGDRLDDPELSWANVVVWDGRFVGVLP